MRVSCQSAVAKGTAGHCCDRAIESALANTAVLRIRVEQLSGGVECHALRPFGIVCARCHKSTDHVAADLAYAAACRDVQISSGVERQSRAVIEACAGRS